MANPVTPDGRDHGKGCKHCRPKTRYYEVDLTAIARVTKTVLIRATDEDDAIEKAVESVGDSGWKIDGLDQVIDELATARPARLAKLRRARA